MSKIKQLIIMVIFLPLIFWLTGCAEHKLNDTKTHIKSLPAGLAELLDDKTGVDGIPHYIVGVNGNKKSEIFTREGKDDQGRDLFQTKEVLGPYPVSMILNQVGYNVTELGEIRVGDQEYRNCNYINAGSEAKLICRKPEGYEHEPFETEDNILPEEVVKHIEASTGEELAYLVLVGRDEIRILRKSTYVTLDPTMRFNPKTKLGTSRTVLTTNVKGSPCCCLVDDGDIKYVTCKTICL